MCSLEKYHINLLGLKADTETFELHLDDDFFAAVEGRDVQHGDVNATVRVTKVGNDFRLEMGVQGRVVVPCDLCLDDMEQPVEATSNLTVKLGSEYAEEDDTVTVDEREGIIDTSWFLYELIVLAIPIRHVHEPGKCNPAMMKVLERHSAARSSGGEQPDDPRWSELAKLKTILND